METTIVDLLIFIEECKKKEENLQNNIEKTLSDLRTLSYFAPTKRYFKELLIEQKKKLEHIRIMKELVIKKIEECSKIKGEVLLPFLVEYLSYKENEQYILLENVKEKGIKLIYNNPYIFITTLENKEKQYDYLKKESISLEADKDEYALLEGTSLASEYSKYPYLINIAYSVINIRLKENDISDIDIINQIKKRNKIKQK